MAVPALVAVLSLGAASEANAAPAPTTSLYNTYSGLYHAVKDKDGSRAPGRNIRRYGVRFKWVSEDHTRKHWGERPPTAAEVATSIRQLRNLLHPHVEAAPPAQPPAGVLTPVTPATPAAAAPARSTSSDLPACTWKPESGGDYRAKNPSGAGGKYQIMPGTWRAYGGSGSDAAAAPPAEQERVAHRIYAAEGGRPWVNC
jgi:hypothetical protein